MKFKNQENNTQGTYKKKDFNEVFEKHVVNLKKKISSSCACDDDSEDENYQFFGSNDKKIGEKNKKKHIIVLILMSFFILILAFVLLFLNEIYSCFKSNGNDRMVDIPYGSSAKKISYILIFNF